MIYGSDEEYINLEVLHIVGSFILFPELNLTDKQKINIMKIFKRISKLGVFVLSLPILLVSCYRTPMAYPAPSENPILLTAENQTKYTMIKNLAGISPENPETDQIISDNHQTETFNPWTMISNDWIIITEGGSMPMEKLKIEVKENSSQQPRSYELKIYSMMQVSILTITQNGKTD